MFCVHDRPPLVLENTSNVHTTGTIIHADPPLSPPAAPADRHLDSNMSRKLTEPSVSGSGRYLTCLEEKCLILSSLRQGLSPPGPTSDTESSGSKEPEDIPTFDEWKRKMMEVEKEKSKIHHRSEQNLYFLPLHPLFFSL